MHKHTEQSHLGKFTKTRLSPFNFQNVWEEICDTMHLDEPFKISDVPRIRAIQHISLRGQTEICREVLLTVEAEGNNQVKRLSKIAWVLPSK